MEPFFLCYTLITNEVLLVPPVVLVIMDGQSSLQDFLSILKCIYNPFEIVFEVHNLYVCKSQNKCAPHRNNIFLYFPKVSSIFIQSNYISWVKPMLAVLGPIWLSTNLTDMVKIRLSDFSSKKYLCPLVMLCRVALYFPVLCIIVLCCVLLWCIFLFYNML